MPETTLRRRKEDAYGLVAGSPFVAFMRNKATPALFYASIYGATGEWESDLGSLTLSDGDYPSQVPAFWIGHDPLGNTSDGSLLFTGRNTGTFNRHRIWDVPAGVVRMYPTVDGNQLTDALYADGYVYWIDFDYTGTSTTFKLYRTTTDFAVPTELGSITRGSGFPASPWDSAEMNQIYGLWMNERDVFLLVQIKYVRAGPDPTEFRFITFPRAGGAGSDVAAATPVAAVNQMALFPASDTETHLPMVDLTINPTLNFRRSALALKDDTEAGYVDLWPADTDYGYAAVGDLEAETISDVLLSLSKSGDNFSAYMQRWELADYNGTATARIVTGPADGPTARIEVQHHPSGERYLPIMMFYRS